MSWMTTQWTNIALYFPQLNLLEANKTPASNEHSHSSSSLEGGWENLSPAFCVGMLTHSSSSHSRSLCCSPAASVVVSHPEAAQPAHTGGKLSLTMVLAVQSWASLRVIPQCLPGYCQSCWGPNLSLLTQIIMTPASTDFTGLGHPSSSHRNTILARAVCACCTSSISPENSPLSQQPPVPGWEMQKERGGLGLQRVYHLWHFPNNIPFLWATSCSISPWTEVFRWLVRMSFFH